MSQHPRRFARAIDPGYAIEAVARFRGHAAEELIHGTARGHALARTRHEVCYLVRTLSHRSYRECGEILGGRDSTTIMASCNIVATLIGNDAAYAEELNRIAILAADLMERAEAPHPPAAQLLARRVMTHGKAATREEIEALAVQMLAVAAILQSDDLTAVEARASALALIARGPATGGAHG